MILFKEDWNRYPNAIVHTSTTNRSWVRLAKQLQEMGVKNYYFHLSLLDPTLEHVDPHSDDLSDEIRARISVEQRYNPWYQFREISRLPPQGGNFPMQFAANRGNVAALWCFYNHITFNLTQPRQTGKSTTAEENIRYLVQNGTRNSTLLWLTKDNDLRIKTIANIKRAESLSPIYLQWKHPKDADNQIQFDNNTNSVWLKTGVAQNNLQGADNLGRGFVVPVLVVDEGPFITFIEKTLQAALPVLSNAMAQAEESGNPYGIMFTTTAGDKGTRDGRYYYNMLQSGMEWDEGLYDCRNRQELKEEVEARCPGTMNIINGTFSHLQLGKTNEWMKNIIAMVGGTPDSINKDFFNRWVAGGSKSPLTLSIQRAVESSVKDPIHLERYHKNRNYVTRWYVEDPDDYMERNVVVAGIDLSAGVSRDSLTFVGIDIKNLKTVFAFNVNETNLIRFGEFVADQMIRFRKLVIIPENKHVGIALIDALLLALPAKGINPYRRVFNLAIQEANTNEERYRKALSMSRFNQQELELAKNLFGYKTGGSGAYSRDTLYSQTLTNAASRTALHIYDSKLAGELLGLEEKNNRIDHRNGNHDDHVVAWLLALWLLMFGKNLDVYGIVGQLSETTELDIDAVITEESARNKMRNEKLRKELDAVGLQLRGTKDLFLTKKLEARLRVLDAQIDEAQDYGSIDQYIRELKNQRSFQSRTAVARMP